MTRFSAFLDACALVPIAQADTLLRLAQVGIYRPLWSEKVLQETVKAIEIIHPDIARSGAAEKRVNLMKDYFLDACVEEVLSLRGMAEVGGFEPPRACTQPAFQASAIGH